MYLTEGGVDVYRASDLYVSEKARQIAPAKVVGTYGSEIFATRSCSSRCCRLTVSFRGDMVADVRRAYDTTRRFGVSIR